MDQPSPIPSPTPPRGGLVVNLARPWHFPSGHADAFIHRRHLRSVVRIPVSLRLCRQDGSCYDEGAGVVQDISFSGLRLSEVQAPLGRLLATCRTVEFRNALAAPGDDAVPGSILRTYSSGLPGFGVEFRFPEAGAEVKLRHLQT
jgi:hypothetical protein